VISFLGGEEAQERIREIDRKKKRRKLNRLKTIMLLLKKISRGMISHC
jgi:hypothetical protein